MTGSIVEAEVVKTASDVELSLRADEIQGTTNQQDMISDHAALEQQPKKQDTVIDCAFLRQQQKQFKANKEDMASGHAPSTK